ncbi:GNAT family N-acetyltransferase [Alteromonas sp. 345S023]|uniref:GNAT family N-acetyltransferase n=1 Tax=Alteromonas profundi TaxID=2696062 RepID=A0A7X5RLJ4_9ALTE|nr:GNAT family N-acetyltransferase [Alteromonas profundi]NDV91515.1 GNAT family N-acetyltransferase [Alteromonas profundi]
MHIQTQRLTLRPLSLDDRQWILTLNRDPLWLKYIGCKNIFTLDDACDYIVQTHAQQQEWGYGLQAIECNKTHQPLGVCGLFNRFAFRYPDLGFALLPEGRGAGICKEACEGVIKWATEQGYEFLTAMTHPENSASQHVLERLGFKPRGYYYDKAFPGQTLFWLNLT